jgi:signal transduction histidine kinase
LISGDEGRLRQVFMNLALNALDAVSEGGHVKISCLDSLDSVMAFVDDDGPGIAQEKADRIFEPFFTTKAKGSGLGLPICNAIITQHGGVIEVSASPLGGARFGVRLPMAV